MDYSCIYLTCLLMLQMTLVLVMLNPVYDVRKITHYMNIAIKRHSRAYILAIITYFGSLIYLGMYIPLQNVYSLIFNNDLNEYDKLLLLNKVEKNYIVAGFSLFMVVVLYGTRALVTYTASLAQLTEKQNESLEIRSNSKVGKKMISLPENILPNLLRVKRSISYETILFTNELKEQLKTVMQNIEFPHNRCTLSSILETSNLTANL